MTGRNAFWLVCALMVALAGCTPRLDPTSQPRPTRLAYVGLDDHIYSVALEGGDPRRMSAVQGEAPLPAGRRFARWPTWTPDGTRLAFMRFEVARQSELRASIFVVDGDGSNLARLFESPGEVPIYMAWSPDGKSLTVLMQQGHELHLRLLTLEGAGAGVVARGSPLYFAWAGDSQRLLLHLNGDEQQSSGAVLEILRLASTDSEIVSDRPADFRAPSWSPDGTRLAYVTRVPGGQAALAVQTADGQGASRLMVVGSEPAFLWSPIEERLAFSSRVEGRPLLYRGIETIKSDGSDRQRVTDGEVAAFFWSPDGKKLAFAGFDQTAGALTWYVSDPDGKNRRQIGSFVPNDDQLFMFSFFDQYAQSHSLWSSDSRHIVYAGSPVESARRTRQSQLGKSRGDEDEGPTRVFVAAVDGNSPPRVLVDGSLGLWPAPGPRKR